MSEYIKKEDVERGIITEYKGKLSEHDSHVFVEFMAFIDDLPTYSFPKTATSGEYIRKADMERILYSTSNAVRIGEEFLELPTYSFPDSAENNTMDIYSDLLRVKHGTMSIDSLIDKVWCGRKAVSK